MIAVESEQGELIKVLKDVSHERFGIHSQFGFISEKRAQRRVQARKRQGYDFTSDDWHCSFEVKQTAPGKFDLEEQQGCDVLRTSEGWLVSTPVGKMKLVEGGADYVSTILEDHEDNAKWLGKVLELFFLAILFIIPIYFLMQHEPAKVEDVEQEKNLEPIVVTIVKPARTVNVQRESNPDIKVKPISQAERSKRAVKRNLGFLGMVGSKDMKKAVGGVPQKLKKASAGAGKGGDAGSGGEVLTGLGKGLKKTTVGNTGVQGLGGVGTKGAGGGKGGYGNTQVASGSGKGISAISVSSSDMVLQGGISRYAINATIAKYLNQVRRCYESRLKTNPQLQGLVEMSFEINSTGRLNFARVNRTTLKDGATEKCIQTKMLGWQFPKPKGGTKVPVKYPFMLRPVGS